MGLEKEAQQCFKDLIQGIRQEMINSEVEVSVDQVKARITKLAEKYEKNMILNIAEDFLEDGAFGAAVRQLRNEWRGF